MYWNCLRKKEPFLKYYEAIAMVGCDRIDIIEKDVHIFNICIIFSN